MSIKKTWGGKRKGAGRDRKFTGETETRSIVFPEGMAKSIDKLVEEEKQSSFSEAVRHACRRQYSLPHE
jgi:hypothetical protein